MKKILFVIFLFFMVFTLSAIEVKVFDHSIEVLPKNSIYGPHKADIWATDMSLHYLGMIEPGPTYVGAVAERIEGKEYWHDNPDPSKREHVVYDRLYFRTDNDRSWSYVRFVLANQIQLARVTYDWASVEAIANGGLNMVFEASGGTDIIGFDGFFFLGGAARLFDKVSVKAGIHHYSGHDGDEVYEALIPDEYGNYKDRMDLSDGEPGKIYDIEHYVRQNSVIVGVTADVTKWLTVYAEGDFIPSTLHVIRPWVLCPNGVKFDKDPSVSVESHVGSDEGAYADETDPNNSRNNPYPDSYRDRILQCGAEIKIPVLNIGILTTAADFMFYEAGKTGYQIGAYDEQLYGWAKDINLYIGFEVLDSGFTVEATYHNGRFPLTHFFFHDCSYWSLGVTYKI